MERWGGGVIPNPFARVEAQTATVDAELRIAAQRLEDGGLQFGLRARDESGSWAEPAEPRVNSFDPANVRTGRWLSSSSLILEVDQSGVGRLVRTEDFQPSPPTETTLITGVEGWDGDIRYSAWNDADGDLITTVSIYSGSAGAPDGELRTTITCREREISVVVGGLSADTTPSDDDSSAVDVSWTVDRGAALSEQRAVWPIEGGVELIGLTESDLGASLLSGGSTLALSLATTPPLRSSIDLDALSELPVYDNLVQCAGDSSASELKSGQTELRIQAQVRDDERVEFAVQQRTDDGWSEQILPDSRSMRAFGNPTPWLSSSTISVEVDVEPSHVIVSPDPVQRSVSPPINPILRSGWLTGSLGYAAELDLEGRLNSIVAAHSEQEWQLQVGCFNGISRVQLTGVPSEATGSMALTLDDMQSAANWRVVTEDDTSVLRPADTARLIERLRGTETVTVNVDQSEPATFELSGMFETPIQANLDQCGNYTDQDWEPVTEVQEGTTSDDVQYDNRYPDWNDGERFTTVTIDATDNKKSASGLPMQLGFHCRSGDFYVHLNDMPIAAGEHTVRSRIDGGEWVEEHWSIDVYANAEGTYTNISAIQGDYALVRNARTVEFEFPGTRVERRLFDLNGFFDTPVQANIDNCGVPLWTQETTYVPILTRGQASASVTYSASVQDSGGIYSVVTNEVSVPGARYDPLELEISCYTLGGQNVRFGWFKVSKTDTLDVTLHIDEREYEAEPWWVPEWTINSDIWFGVDSPDASRLIARLRNASSLTVTISDTKVTDVRPTTFDLAGMFDTPIQENIDECGYYKPGETREPPLALNTSGNTQGINGDATAIFWSRQRGAGSVPYVAVGELAQTTEAMNSLGLYMTCGPTSTTMFLYGSLLSELGGAAEVEWNVDADPVVSESWVWNLSGSNGFLYAADPLAVIAKWRAGAVLNVTIDGAEPIQQRFDLGAMFSIPVVDTLDECLSRPSPAWSPPVQDVLTTRENNVSYVASGATSAWAATQLQLRVPSDTAPEWAPFSSLLIVNCGVEGIGAGVMRIGNAQSVVISGDTVEVTWRAGDGLPQTETWDAWSPPWGTYSISPPDDAAFFAAIRDADSLSISVTSDPVFTETYDLSGNGFWDTPVQPNLDACGGP